MTVLKVSRLKAATIAIVAMTNAAPALAQSPEASQAQDLTNCAGAVAAFANLSVLSPQTNANGEWSVALGAILARMNNEPNIEGMTGRIAADAARMYWAERPRAEQETQARQCQTRFSAA